MGSYRELDIDGHKIAAIEYNKERGGVPVVFIHGTTASINFWEPIQLPVFNNNYHWISLSLPGHYPATFPPGLKTHDLTIEMIGNLLIKAIRKLIGEQPAIWAGHSMGGLAALYIGATYPEAVSGIISISGLARAKVKGTLGLLQVFARAGFIGRWIFKTDIKILASSRLVYKFAAGFYVHDRKAFYSFPNFDMILNTVHGDLKKADPKALFQYFYRQPDIDISEKLRKITAPTLVLAGDTDPIIPSDQSHLIVNNISNSKKVMIEGSGHLPMFERPQVYAKTISEWIENI